MTTSNLDNLLRGLKGPLVGEVTPRSLVAFTALVGAATLAINPDFGYALDLVPQNLHLFTLAFCMMLTLVVGSIDLSLGYTVALTSVLFAKVAQYNLLIGLAVAVAVGGIAGCCNGILSLKSGNSYIATLMTGYIIRGLSVGISGGSSILVSFDLFKGVGPLWIGFAVLLGVALTVPRTRFGLALYATGDCREAAQLYVETDACYVLAHICASIGASLAAIISCSRLGAASPLLGSGWEVDAVAACILGGCEFNGGTGYPTRVFTALIGLLLTKRLLYFLSFPPELYWVFLGGLVLTFLDKPFNINLRFRRLF